MSLSKRQKAIEAEIKPGVVYDFAEAYALLQKHSTVKFKESVEICINLGIDPRKSDQTVRGATQLPHGTGNDVRVLVFAEAENAKAAKDAGADRVGFEDLVAAVKGGDLDFDVVIATPNTMRVVGTLGQILGPRGLMPNPKVGTVTKDVATAVKNAKAGQLRFRADKGGIIHGAIGKIDFDANAIKENLEALIADLKKAKPASTKGTYLKKISMSTTMGPGLIIDQSTVDG